MGERRPTLEHVEPGRTEHRDLPEVVHHVQRLEPGRFRPAGELAQVRSEL